MITSLSDERLVDLLRSYKGYDERSKLRILAGVVKNLRRALPPDETCAYARWDEVVTSLLADDASVNHAVVAVANLWREVPDDRSETKTRLTLTGNETAGALLSKLGQATAALPRTAAAHLRQAVGLHEQGLSPILTYAFNSWQLEAESPLDLGRRLAELQVMGLHRLASIAPLTTPGHRIATGTMAELIATPFGEVTKVPLNVAARDVIHPLEHRNFEVLRQHGLVPRIPGRVRFDAGTSKLTREFVPGPDGLAVLRARGRPTARQVADLRVLYELLQAAVARIGSPLDLHPGNFVWQEELEMWFLVDLGPIPLIGCEEYVGPSFARYLGHTWLDRQRRELSEPVRSLDYLVGAKESNTLSIAEQS